MNLSDLETGESNLLFLYEGRYEFLHMQTVTHKQLSAVERVFQENFVSRGELGASICIMQHEEVLLDLAQGWCEKEQVTPWTAETLVPVYSATKGPAAITLLSVLEKYALTSENLVSEVWPMFPVEDATFAHLMSHQCGLPALDTRADVFDYGAVISAIEGTNPAWFLGQGHGYHPRTFGFLLDECVRRITGQTLGEMWNTLIRQPLALDFWIGLPDEEHSKVARLYPGKMDKSDLQSGFYREFNTEGTVTRRAFSSPRGIHAVADMNKPDAWRLGLPAMGGVGTARSLALFYDATLRSSLFSPAIKTALQDVVVSGQDQVLMQSTAFSHGFMKDPMTNGRKDRQLFGPSETAYGHPGAGGSHAFADPENGISFCYTMNQMELAVLPNEKSRSMVRALYSL